MSTPTPKNSAAFLDSPGTPFTIRDAPMPNPAANEIVIRVAAVAVNPVDAGRKELGFMIEKFPWVFGCDGAGTITAVGGGVDERAFKIGDRVIALSDEWIVHKASNGMYQRYASLGLGCVTKLPNTIDFTDGVVLPLGVFTATSMMFSPGNLDLSWPVGKDKSVVVAPEGKVKTGMEKQVVVVWGGSSSVGASAIQLARAAGYNVVSTASERNFGLVRECGANEVFDHKDDGVVDNVCKWVEGRELTLAGIADAISSDDTVNRCSAIAQRLEGNKFVSTSRATGVQPAPIVPERVKASTALGIKEPELQEYIFEKWMYPALESGQLKCKPNAHIVGTSLEALNEACAMMSKGVSGQKLVVKLD